MNRKVYLLAITAFLFASFSFPKKYRVFNEWSNVTLVDTLLHTQLGDTLLAICSNREFNPDSQEFLGHVANDDHAINYFVATYKDGKWFLDHVANLSVVFQYLPERNLLVYAEGMGKTLPLNLQRGAGMTSQYGINVLMFDYPSIHPDKSIVSNFYYAYNQAKMARNGFTDFLKQFSQYYSSHNCAFNGINTSLFFHSMGNQIIKQTMLHNAETLTTLNEHLFDNVILNAACVPRRNHTDWIGKLEFASRTYVHYNKGDRQLNMASIITLDKMLGVNPGNSRPKNVQYVDFNNLVNNRHSTFLNIDGREPIKKEAYLYYYAVLHGYAPNKSDSTLFATSDEDGMVLVSGY